MTSLSQLKQIISQSVAPETFFWRRGESKTENNYFWQEIQFDVVMIPLKLTEISTFTLEGFIDLLFRIIINPFWFSFTLSLETSQPEGLHGHVF